MPLPPVNLNESKEDYIQRALRAIGDKIALEKSLPLLHAVWSKQNEMSVAGRGNTFLGKHLKDKDKKFRTYNDEKIFDSSEHTVDELKEIVYNTNRRAEEGVGVLITLGHVRQDLPDHDPAQPPTIGVGYNLKLKKTDTKTYITSDLDLLEEQVDTIKGKHPFANKSIDLAHGLNLIPRLAILTKSVPKKNLPILEFSQFEFDCETTTYLKQFDKEEIMSQNQEVEKSLEDVVRELADRLNQLEAMVASLQPVEETVEEPVEPVEPEEDKTETNQDEPKEEDETDKDEEEQNQITEYQLRIDSLEKRVRVSERKEELSKLAFVKSFDLTTEVDYCSDMSDEQYAIHKTVINKNYKDVPTGDSATIKTIDPKQYGEPGEMTKTEMLEVVQHCQDNNLNSAKDFDKVAVKLGFKK